MLLALMWTTDQAELNKYVCIRKLWQNIQKNCENKGFIK